MQSGKKKGFEQTDGRAGCGLNRRWRNRTGQHKGRRGLSGFESEAG